MPANLAQRPIYPVVRERCSLSPKKRTVYVSTGREDCSIRTSRGTKSKLVAS
jgi:hypothetical protein